MAWCKAFWKQWSSVQNSGHLVRALWTCAGESSRKIVYWRIFLPSVGRWLSRFNSFFSVCDSNSQVCDIYFSIHVLAVLFTFLCFSLADIPQLHKSGGRGWLACCCCGDLSLKALCWKCWAYNFKTLHAIEADNYFPAAFYTLVWEGKNF